MADTFRALTAMTPGKKYKVVYKGERQHYNREAIMVFLGTEGNNTSWDARPFAGTQTMPSSWIVAVFQVDPCTKVYLDRRSGHK